jgi:hypothetical protein
MGKAWVYVFSQAVDFQDYFGLILYLIRKVGVEKGTVSDDDGGVGL